MEFRIIERKIHYEVYGKGVEKASVYNLQAKLGLFRRWKNISHDGKSLHRAYRVRNSRQYFAMYRDAVEELDKIKKKLWKLNKGSDMIYDTGKVIMEMKVSYD